MEEEVEVGRDRDRDRGRLVFCVVFFCFRLTGTARGKREGWERKDKEQKKRGIRVERQRKRNKLESGKRGHITDMRKERECRT
jgi:hypothetical protein